MSETAAIAHSELVTELKASAHLMRLDPGLYCVYHSEGSQLPDPVTGLPGARLTLPPGSISGGVVISGFRDDGWISVDSASLIHVSAAPAQVLMTVYQLPGSGLEAPRMQVRRLIEGVATPPAVIAQAPVAAGQNGAHAGAGPAGHEDTTATVAGTQGVAAPEPEVAAHVQLRGDVLAQIGDWIGERGSQRWIEGFAVAPRQGVRVADIEYQAVLGRGWLSPWAEGGQYCGSRGMALPILGLRARLRGEAASTHVLEVSATFTDGTEVGPVGAGQPCESDSLAPLEAFKLTIRAMHETSEAATANDVRQAERPARRSAPKKPAAPVVQAPSRAQSSRVPPAIMTRPEAVKTKPAGKPAPAGPASKSPSKPTAPGKRGAPPAKGRGRRT